MSIKILSAACKSFTLPLVTSPIILIAKPGPGKGCLPIKLFLIFRALPKSLTSSLNKSLKGSI